MARRKYLKVVRKPGGASYLYFHYRGNLTPLDAPEGTPEFERQYAAALQAAEADEAREAVALIEDATAAREREAREREAARLWAAHRQAQAAVRLAENVWARLLPTAREVAPFSGAKAVRKLEELKRALPGVDWPALERSCGAVAVPYRAPIRRRRTTLYAITCEPTGRLYVGFARDPDARFRQHMSGRTGPRVAGAVREHGPDAFTFQVLHTYANPTEAAHAEREVIAHLDLTGPNGMNTGRGGEGARRKKWIIEPIQDGGEAAMT
jgi:predicted GIY-YIG superfamily endonuclease